jgi:hypothetical protein
MFFRDLRPQDQGGKAGATAFFGLFRCAALDFSPVSPIVLRHIFPASFLKGVEP